MCVYCFTPIVEFLLGPKKVPEKITPRKQHQDALADLLPALESLSHCHLGQRPLMENHNSEWVNQLCVLCICICIYIYAIFNSRCVKYSSTTGGEPSMKNHICPFFHPSIYSFTCTSIKKENNIYLSIEKSILLIIYLSIDLY